MVDTVTEVGPTKRQVVSLTVRFFDPRGSLHLLSSHFKSLWKSCVKLVWDGMNPLRVNLWKGGGFSYKNRESANQSVFPTDSVFRAYELHGFCDASTTAYAAVVYLLVKGEGDCTVKIIASKSRVAPLQTKIETLGSSLTLTTNEVRDQQYRNGD